MSLREFFAIRGKPKASAIQPAEFRFPAHVGMPPPPARTEIKRGDYEICLILKTLEAILANLQDVNASLASLNSEVQLAIQKIGGSAASAADLDAVKAGIDAATSALQSALNPPPAV